MTAAESTAVADRSQGRRQSMAGRVLLRLLASVFKLILWVVLSL
jgi:hypothetical protein